MSHDQGKQSSDRSMTTDHGQEAGSWLDLENTLQQTGDDAHGAEFIQEEGAYADSSYARVRSRAQKGDVEAQFELCMRYHFGQGGVEQDNEASYRWCYEAAKQEHAWALANLGWMYESGAGVDRDESKAAEAYRAAADKGLPEAMVWLGQMLEQGRGVDESPEAAFEWYMRAAETGNAEGQYNVALCYQFGKGVDKDENIASSWYKKASEQQHVEALYNLGWLYSQGRGVAKNTARAKELFNIAAGRSDSESDELIIEAMDYGQGKGGVHKDLEKSHALYLQAANKGSFSAMFTVGVNYEYGLGVKKSWPDAKEWYKKSANHGHPEAAFRYRFRQLFIQNRLIRFFRYSGVVAASGHGMETGRNNGAIGQFSRGNRGGHQRKRRRVKGTKFFLDTDLGERVEVELPFPVKALYQQEQVTLIYAIKQGERTGPYMLLVNHDDNNHCQPLATPQSFWDEQIAGTNYLLGLVLLIATIGVPLLTGIYLPSATETALTPLLHPFNWIIFIPLGVVFVFWVKTVMARRHQGIHAVQQRMAEIKDWIQHSSTAKKH